MWQMAATATTAKRVGNLGYSVTQLHRISWKNLHNMAGKTINPNGESKAKENKHGRRSVSIAD